MTIIHTMLFLSFAII